MSEGRTVADHVGRRYEREVLKVNEVLNAQD